MGTLLHLSLYVKNSRKEFIQELETESILVFEVLQHRKDVFSHNGCSKIVPRVEVRKAMEQY